MRKLPVQVTKKNFGEKKKSQVSVLSQCPCQGVWCRLLCASRLAQVSSPYAQSPSESHCQPPGPKREFLQSAEWSNRFSDFCVGRSRCCSSFPLQTRDKSERISNCKKEKIGLTRGESLDEHVIFNNVLQTRLVIHDFSQTLYTIRLEKNTVETVGIISSSFSEFSLQILEQYFQSMVSEEKG